MIAFAGVLIFCAQNENGAGHRRACSSDFSFLKNGG